jgi:tellurite resistance-related uncharacterized protein
MNRAIVNFCLDEQADWAAELVCGHRQHTRHNPPVSERPWVLTPEGRAAKLGTFLNCLLCDRKQVPDGFEAYQRTRDFDETSIPKGLLEAHSTKCGVWALIHVVRGELEYVIHEPFNQRHVVLPDTPGIILPEVPHHVSPIGSVAFCVEFWRATSN